MRREVAIRGVVINFNWKNPHSYLTIRTLGESSVEQVIEVGPPATLRPLGLTQDSLRVGEEVVVRAHPALRGKVVLGRELTKADNSVLPLLMDGRNARPEPLQPAASIEGRWVSQGFHPMLASVRSWPFTEKGRSHIATRDQLQTSHVQCVPVTAPMLMLYPVVNEIDVEREVVRMKIDWMGAERNVYMDGRAAPPNGERTLHGHSVGRWDEQTLVIETTHFADHSDGNFMTVPSGAGKHLIERLTLTEDRRHLRYDVELRDPEWLAAPVTHSALFDYRPELAPSGLPCDSEAARRFLTEP